MKAMILAAGYGTRLGEITQAKPKILVDLGGITLLEWILIKLKVSGFDDIIMNIHHMADMVEEEGIKIAKRVGVRLSFSDEREELLDTGGGLYKAREFFDNEPFLLYNGDVVTDLDLRKIYSYHLRKGASATIATRERQGNRFFLVDQTGTVRGWTNRQSNIDIVTVDEPIELTEIASMAISVFNTQVFDIMQEGKYTMTSVILELAGKELVTTFRYDSGYWIDIGSPRKLEEARELLL